LSAGSRWRSPGGGAGAARLATAGLTACSSPQQSSGRCGNPGNHAGPPPRQSYARSTPNSWAQTSVDEQLGLVHRPSGNAAPDHFGARRSAQSERFAGSFVAINAVTGLLRWLFETAHHDLWDYDAASQPTLINFPGPGGPIPVLVQPTERSEVSVLDRRTGLPLTRVEELLAPSAAKCPRNGPPRPSRFRSACPTFRADC